MDSEHSIDMILHSIHRLGELIEKVVDETYKLFNDNDIESRKDTWREVSNLGSVIEELRRIIIHDILMYVVKYQPLGRDLVASYVLLNITYDIYRISRYCREIAKADQILAPKSGIANLELREIFEKANIAVKYSITDLLDLKPSNRGKIQEIDEFIDNYYAETMRSIIEGETTTSIKALKLLVIRHIERIIDHTQYIEQYLSELY